jgi:hypothetical protein
MHQDKVGIESSLLPRPPSHKHEPVSHHAICLSSLLLRPVKPDILARLDLTECRIAAHGTPDLRLELSGRNIIAEERVVCVHCISIHSTKPASMELTAVESTRPLDVIRAVSDRTPQTRTIAPHHLREVAPRILVVRIVVRVLCLFLVPAVRGGAREFDPRVVGGWCGADGGEVASWAFLIPSYQP